MSGFKKVACLYRVSTKIQLEENDIPMQRTACADFIKTKPLWEFDREYLERGVSGYHKKEAQRDILQQMKQDAENKVFDVLLVFMFDRLGRREDETPFIVEWLVGKGVEVWSVKEGQQKFDSRTDKLLNYIRYWQSGGESEKTAMRVYESHKQMAEAGIYRGGRPPFGYKRVPNGQFNKKGYPLNKLAIDEINGEIIKTIFAMACKPDMGCSRICDYLNERDIKTTIGNTWQPTTLYHLIHNPIYKGYSAFGRRKGHRGYSQKTLPDEWIYPSERQYELVIVDEETWQTANDMLKVRYTKQEGHLTSVRDPANFLMDRFLKCGHCGGKLATVTAVKYRIKDGVQTNEQYCTTYYGCRTRYKTGKCKESFMQNSIKTDKLIISEIYAYLDNLKKINLGKKLNDKKNRFLKESKTQLSPLLSDIQVAENQLSKLNDEVIKCLMGESKFSTEQLSRLTEQKENELKKLYEQKEVIEAEQQELLLEFSQLEEIQSIIPTWKNEFENASIEEKQILLSKLIDYILLSRNNVEIHFKLNIYKIESIYGSNL